MNIAQLIEAAATAKGSHKDLAQSMGKASARLSEWKKGRQHPDANEIGYLAQVAGWPILPTVAKIESQLHPEAASLWASALDQIALRPSDPRDPLYIMSSGQREKTRHKPGFFMGAGSRFADFLRN